MPPPKNRPVPEPGPRRASTALRVAGWQALGALVLLVSCLIAWSVVPGTWRHGMETRALAWLQTRHVQRTTGAVEPASANTPHRQPSVAEPSTAGESAATEAARLQLAVAGPTDAEFPTAEGVSDAPSVPIFMAEPDPAADRDGFPDGQDDEPRMMPTASAMTPPEDHAAAAKVGTDATSWIATAPLSSLTQEQAAVARWLSRRYRVAKEPLARLVQEAWLAGEEAGLDPALVLAVAAIESRFNPLAQSPMGAQGLMQVVTRVHEEKFEAFGGAQAAFDPIANLRVGAQILHDLIGRRGGVEEGLRAYVGATTTSGEGYTRRVLSERDYLKRVMKGHRLSPHVVARAPTSRPPAPRADRQPPATPTPKTRLAAQERESAHDRATTP